MEKPLSLRRDDFAKDLVSLVNGSGLPAFVCADILRQAAAEAGEIAVQQLASDRAAWEKAREGEKDG